MAREILSKHGGATKDAQEEFARWITRCPGLSGGERAYRNLDDSGRVYQSAGMAAPEQRTDPKFFEPLVHPKTGKPCPVPPYGWSRTPETMQALLDAGTSYLERTRRRSLVASSTSGMTSAGRFRLSSRMLLGGRPTSTRLGSSFPTVTLSHSTKRLLAELQRRRMRSCWTSSPAAAPPARPASSWGVTSFWWMTTRRRSL